MLSSPVKEACSSPRTTGLLTGEFSVEIGLREQERGGLLLVRIALSGSFTAISRFMVLVWKRSIEKSDKTERQQQLIGAREPAPLGGGHSP